MKATKAKPLAVFCPYCANAAEMVTGEVMYPHRADLAEKKFWRCVPCDAYVGCHAMGSGDTPLGTLANAETRLARQKAHAAFDPLWRRGGMSRGEAYRYLAKLLEIDPADCHISWFQADMCRLVVEVLT